MTSAVTSKCFQSGFPAGAAKCGALWIEAGRENMYLRCVDRHFEQYVNVCELYVMCVYLIMTEIAINVLIVLNIRYTMNSELQGPQRTVTSL